MQPPVNKDFAQALEATLRAYASLPATLQRSASIDIFSDSAIALSINPDLAEPEMHRTGFLWRMRPRTATTMLHDLDAGRNRFNDFVLRISLWFEATDYKYLSRDTAIDRIAEAGLAATMAMAGFISEV